MKHILNASFLAALLCASAPADTVTLKSGGVVKGRITGENAFELKIEVARNAEGTIKTTMIIDHKEIVSTSRENPSVQTVDYSRGIEVNLVRSGSVKKPTLSPAEAVKEDLARYEILMQQSSGLVSRGQYEEALRNYEMIAKDSRLVSLAKSGSHTDVLASLQLRQKSYNLWSIALEGQAKMLEHKSKLQVDQTEKRLKYYEDQLKTTRDKIADAKKDRQGKSSTTFRVANALPGSIEQKLEQYEKQVEAQKAALAQSRDWLTEQQIKVKNLEAEAKMLDEKGDYLKKEIQTLTRRKRR